MQMKREITSKIAEADGQPRHKCKGDADSFFQCLQPITSSSGRKYLSDLPLYRFFFISVAELVMGIIPFSYENSGTDIHPDRNCLTWKKTDDIMIVDEKSDELELFLGKLHQAYQRCTLKIHPIGFVTTPYDPSICSPTQNWLIRLFHSIERAHLSVHFIRPCPNRRLLFGPRALNSHVCWTVRLDSAICCARSATAGMCNRIFPLPLFEITAIAPCAGLVSGSARC